MPTISNLLSIIALLGLVGTAIGIFILHNKELVLMSVAFALSGAGGLAIIQIDINHLDEGGNTPKE